MTSGISRRSVSGGILICLSVSCRLNTIKPQFYEVWFMLGHDTFNDYLTVGSQHIWRLFYCWVTTHFTRKTPCWVTAHINGIMVGRDSFSKKFDGPWHRFPEPSKILRPNGHLIYDRSLRYPSFRIVYLSHLVQEPPKMLIQSPKVGSLIANHIVIWGPPIGLRDCLQHVFLLREIVKTLFLCMNLWNGIHAWCVLACKRKRKKTKKKIL